MLEGKRSAMPNGPFQSFHEHRLDGQAGTKGQGDAGTFGIRLHQTFQDEQDRGGGHVPIVGQNVAGRTQLMGLQIQGFPAGGKNARPARMDRPRTDVFQTAIISIEPLGQPRPQRLPNQVGDRGRKHHFKPMIADAPAH